MVVSAAILFIVVIALAGLGFVVVKALGGEEVKLPKGMEVTVPEGKLLKPIDEAPDGGEIYEFPAGCSVRYSKEQKPTTRSEPFRVKVPRGFIGERGLLVLMDISGTQFAHVVTPERHRPQLEKEAERRGETVAEFHRIQLPAGCTQVVPGSSWGTFTIAATIPIALLVGLWMYRIRPGRVVEASLIGGTLTLAAVVAGNWVPGSPLERFFSLTREQTIVVLGAYGFVAAVLPVWLLLGPRDYLSSFLKIGTVALLVVSVCVANPSLEAPPVNEVFLNGGPTFPGNIFPFVFICVMCGAISGFHALVASGTTPKMVEKESQVRMIGYGAMLIEGLVGVVALIAAAALPSDLYYAINVPIDAAPKWQKQLDQVYDKYGVRVPPEANDPAHAAGVDAPQHLNLGQVEEKVGGESLRGRTGGAVTLAVGMSVIFDEAFRWFGVTGSWLLKYWYHFAIMFEALFILTTIDAGTRIARFLFQETAGRVYAPFGRQDWLPGALLASGLVTVGWCWLVSTGSIMTIWPMFGIANQILSVLALALVTTWMVNHGRGRYAPITILPMLFVCSTTLTAAAEMVAGPFSLMITDGRAKVAEGATAAGEKLIFTGYLNSAMTIFVVACVLTLLLWSAARWLAVWLGRAAPKPTNGTPNPSGAA
jgi:carbon starvation protein